MSKQITITVPDKTTYAIVSTTGEPTRFTFYGEVEWTEDAQSLNDTIKGLVNHSPSFCCCNRFEPFVIITLKVM